LKTNLPIWIRHLEECREFTAGDGCHLRELLHAEKDRLDLGYSLAHARVAPGEKTKPHKLAASEVYYILQGRGLMRIGKEMREVRPHHVIYIPPRAVQSIENPGKEDLVFLCFVDPAWCREDETILEKT